MTTLGPKKDGAPNADFFQSPETLAQFDQIRVWLQKNSKKHVQTDPPTKEGLAQLVVQLIQYQENKLGKNAADPPFLRLPDEYAILDGPLAEALARDSSSEDEEEFTEDQIQNLLESDDDLILEDEVAEEQIRWSSDYSQFRGFQEAFNEEVGPQIDGTDPLTLFTQIWDQPLLEHIAEETNKYGFGKIASYFETEDAMHPKSRDRLWVETGIDELYRLFAVIMLMSMCVRGRIEEYWSTGILGMPNFRKIMSRDRYIMLLKFLHFADNNTIHARGPDRKLHKIKPVIDHLNTKFQSIYKPRREVSLDESLLLWKGHLSWKQCIRSKAARFGIKSYELCEAVTGYVLNIMIYTGKGTSATNALFGFTSSTAKIVLQLFKDYLGKGYSLFMDNFYNSIALTRFLKSKKTDVVGTLNRRRTDTPTEIKALQDRRMARGAMVSLHCGDVSVTSWKDVKLVSTVSTYHNADMAPGQRPGQDCPKPIVVHDYNKFMGGVDLKDQKLSMYLLERKRGIKWYIKVFRRLLNISILNTYIIYCANMGENRKITHREFRYKLVEQICERFGSDVIPRIRVGQVLGRLDKQFDHFPIHIDVVGERTAKQERYKRGRCARCTAKKNNISCSHCKIFLCVGQCWHDFHTLENL